MAFAVENVSDGFDASVPVTPPLNIIAGFDAVKRGPGARISEHANRGGGVHSSILARLFALSAETAATSLGASLLAI